MPKPKAFMTFAMEWKQKNAPNMTPTEAVKHAGPFWEKMSSDERQKYVDKSSIITLDSNKPKKKPLTCVRTNVEVELKMENENKRKEQLEIEKIQKTIRNARDLKNQKFYFMFVNFFIPENAVPAEIALIEFSLKEGVCRKKNWYVNPNADFYGMLATCMKHVSSTHQLPLPPNSLGKCDPQEIYFEILEFLNIDARRTNNVGDYPPLYTDNTYIQAVGQALTSLVTNKKLTVRDFDIYSIQQLFYILKYATSENKGAKPKNIHITNIIIDRDSFEFEEEIACQYHQEIDRTRYCALSKVIRWAYTFADYLLNDLNLEFIPGKHCPKNTANVSNVQEVCEAVSELALDKEVSDSKSIKTSTNLIPLQTSLRREQAFSLPQCISSSNEWQRVDQSLPPDSSFFEIDPVESTLLAPALRSNAGRGIALLDDHEVPRFGGKGRGRLFGRGIAIFNESSLSSASGTERVNHANGFQF